MTEKGARQLVAEMARTPEMVAQMRAVVDDALAAGRIGDAEAKSMHEQIDAAEERGKR